MNTKEDEYVNDFDRTKKLRLDYDIDIGRTSPMKSAKTTLIGTLEIRTCPTKVMETPKLLQRKRACLKTRSKSLFRFSQIKSRNSIFLQVSLIRLLTLRSKKFSLLNLTSQLSEFQAQSRKYRKGRCR